MENEKLLEMVTSFVKTLNDNQFSDFMKLNEKILENCDKNFFISEKSQLNFIMKSYALKKLDLSCNSVDESEKYKLVNKIYFDEIFKINSIIQNDLLLKKINGAKIFIFGETGTGKTTLVQKIVKDNPSILFKDNINLTSLISYKMGQTQLNLIKLSKEIKEIEGKAIIFIDEIDSIITNRVNSDLGEHSRIIATFLTFLDDLPSNIILIAVTNLKKSIDDAVIRRFNIIFETRKLNIDEFISALEKEGIKMEKGKEEIIKKFLNKKNFSFSDVNLIKTEKYILESINCNEEVENWPIVLKYFEKYILSIPVSNINWSFRDKKIIKKFKLNSILGENNE